MRTAYGPSPDEDRAADLYREVLAELRGQGAFAYLDLSFIRYSDGSFYVTVDAVDPVDAERRMPFRPAPSDTIPDPGGLLARWQEYQEKYFSLWTEGALGPSREECPFWHCLPGFEHPALVPYTEAFAEQVPAHREALERILMQDRDAQRRARAAFLLAHLEDGEVLVPLLLPALTDPSSTVRNNALLVLGGIAQAHPEVDFPVQPVLAALRYPDTTDRNKAANVVFRLLAHPQGREQHREQIIREAGPILLKMLRLQQPDNHDLAYHILRLVSGAEYGARDYAAWEGWLEEQLRR